MFYRVDMVLPPSSYHTTFETACGIQMGGCDWDY